MELGDNVAVEIRDGLLVITVDPNEDLGVSASGKSRIVASTRGNAKVPASLGVSGLVIGLNIYRPTR